MGWLSGSLPHTPPVRPSCLVLVPALVPRTSSSVCVPEFCVSNNITRSTARYRLGRSVGWSESGRTAVPPAGRVGRSGAPNPNLLLRTVRGGSVGLDVPSRKPLILLSWVGRARRNDYFQLRAATWPFLRLSLARKPTRREAGPGSCAALHGTCTCSHIYGCWLVIARPIPY